ncbi:YybH family protein [Psychromarinibacter halotolerans]|uniref:YybH family protein n=1 Tax=Psychromarinibacter halotolerans TaxID=1775175 RepID=A0ABV7GNX1_9RHOB|nr:SgcJ/EcaC family oxidoreductase [Psychromarinibacter halotolerans]MDF0597054.1 SgcJ/EcaC family oxidoreductase [Psychromarinibacter halotolerans]
MSLTSPEDMPAAFARAWMARDAGALAALFAEDADFVNVVGIWWEDRPAIEAAHGYALGSFFADSRLVPGRVKLRRLGDNVAVVHCRFLLTGQRRPGGGAAGRRSTIICFVMQRTAEGWRCVTAQNTDIVPGAETQLADETGLKPQDYR